MPDEEVALASLLQRQETRRALPAVPPAHADVSAPAEWPASEQGAKAQRKARQRSTPRTRSASLETGWFDLLLLGPLLWMPVEVAIGWLSICTRVVQELAPGGSILATIVLSIALRLLVMAGCAVARSSSLGSTFVVLANGVCLPLMDLARYVQTP